MQQEKPKMRLKEYIDSRCVNIKKFARECGVSYSMILRIYHESCPNLSLSMGIKIVKGTKGQVKLKDLVPLQLLKDLNLKLD